MAEARVDDLALPPAYTRGRVVDRAGQLAVYRARRGDQDVVVVVAPSRTREEDRAFRDDVRALDEALRGPGYLPIADVSIAGVRAIARPWIAGAPLRVGEQRPLLDALALLDPVARALGRAHRAGVGHRALSPERVVVGPGGAVVVDLAIAARLALPHAPAYVAPEQLEPRPTVPAAATDVHGLALLFIAVVTGASPYGEAGDLYARVLDRQHRPSLRAHGVVAAAAIDRVLERALAVDPETRFGSADAFWEALRAAVFASPQIGGEPTRPRPATHAPAPHAKTPRAPTSIVLGASVAIIATAFAVEAIVGRVHRRNPTPVAPASVSAPVPSVVVAAAPSVSAPSPTLVPPPEMVPVDERLWIDRTEVTVGAYRACVAAGACLETYKRGSGYSEADPVRREWICNLHRKGREEHPVNCINYNQATAYCAFVHKRLPTGDEWTRGARGSEARKYPWGDTLPRCREVVFARYGPNNFGCSKQPVGTAPADAHPKTASASGALDMAGSLWEWTTERSPRGFPILRGGSWDSPETGITVDARLEQSPGNGDVTLGFRCARDGA